jgi:hypothetical protein
VLGFATVEVYYAIGGATAVCALLVSLLGVVRKDFPGSRGGEIAVGVVFAALVVATVSAAVIGSINNSEHDEDEDHAAVPALIA